MDKNGLLEIIAAHRKDDDLDEVLRKNKDYQEALAQQKEAFSMLDDLGLTAEQEKVIDQAITANNHTVAVYGAVAYRLGMEDGIRVRMEMEEIDMLLKNSLFGKVFPLFVFQILMYIHTFLNFLRNLSNCILSFVYCILSKNWG